MHSIRVIHIASGDLWAGAENVVYQLAIAQHAQPDIVVSAMLLNDGILAEKLRDAGVQVDVVDESKLGFLRLVRRAIRVCRRERPDIIHTHRRKENILGAICGLFATGAQGIRTVHGGEEHAPGSARARLSSWLDRGLAARLQKRVVLVSDELEQRIGSLYPAQKTRVIPNGLADDVQAVEPAHLPGPVEAYKVLFAGRLTRVKRLDLLLEAAASMIGDGRSVCFYIAGAGPEAGFVERFVASNGLAEHVFVLGFRDDIAAVIAAADALVLCSDHEGLPMVVLEAMGLGTLVVARNVGDLGNVLDDGRCGVTWDPGAASLADTLTDVLDAKDRYADRVDAARRRVSEHYSIRDTAAEYSSLYREVLER